MALPIITATHAYTLNVGGVAQPTDTVYYTKGSTTDVFNPGSCVKLLTLLTINSIYGGVFTAQVTIVASDLSTGTLAGLQVGDIWPVDSLNWGLMLPSGNDAARALARAGGQKLIDDGGGGTDAFDRFVQEMNTVAASIGANQDSTYGDPSGAGESEFTQNQISMRDMVEICKAVDAVPALDKYSAWGRVFVDLTRGGPFQLVQQSTTEIVGQGRTTVAKGGIWSGTAFLAGIYKTKSGDRVCTVLYSTTQADRYPDWWAIQDQLEIDEPALDNYPVGQEFDPEDLKAAVSTAGTWIDPSLLQDFQESGRTTAAAVDDPVGSATDNYGYSQHFNQSGAAARPILRNDGTHYYYEFDGGNDYLTRGAPNIGNMSLFCGAGQAWMGVMAVGLANSTAIGTFLAKGGANQNQRTFHMYRTAEAARDPDVVIRGTTQSQDDQVNNVGPYVVGFAWTGTEFYFWGAPRANQGKAAGPRRYGEGNNAEQTAENILLGARTSGAPGFFLDGRIYSMVLIDSYDETLWRDAMYWYQENIQGRAAPLSLTAPQGVNVDGVNDRLQREGPLTGLINGRQATLSFWFKEGGGVNNTLFSADNFKYFMREPISAGKIQLQGRNAANTPILTVTSLNNYDDGNWHHCCLSFDLITGTAHLYIDDVDDLDTGNLLLTNEDIDWAQNDHFFFSNSDIGELYQGCIADFYHKFNTYTDLSQASERLKLVGPGASYSRDLGADGTATGLPAPEIYFAGETANWHINKGIGGGYTPFGALTDCATNPPDYDMPSPVSGLYIGANLVQAVKLGSSDVQKIYLGSQAIWP